MLVKYNKFINFYFFILFFLSITFSINSIAYGQEMSFKVTLDKDKISLGTSTKLNLNFYGVGNVSVPNLPSVEGLNFKYLGPSTRMSVINGKTSSSVTHIYRIVALKTGKFEIPSLSVEYDGEKYSSQPLPIEVISGPVDLSQGEGSSQDYAQDIKDKIFLTIEADKKKAYVNESINLTIKFYANQLSIRDIQYPQIVDKGFLIEKFSQPIQYQDVLGGVVHDVIEFKTKVSALTTGELTLGPAQVGCNLLLRKSQKRRFSNDDFFGSDIFSGFFGGYERYALNLESPDIKITVIDLPNQNIPSGFEGALGNYNFYLVAEPREVKVGDPITLKMIIKGQGNLKTVKSPKLNFGDNFKIYQPQVNHAEDRRMIEQVVIPKSETVVEIPEISFSFFNPETGSYKTIAKGPIPIIVKPLAEGEEFKVFEPRQITKSEMVQKEILGRDIIYIKDRPEPFRKKGKFLYKNKLFIFWQSIPISLVILVLFLSRRRRRLQTDIRYARSLKAPKSARKNLRKVKQLLNLGNKNKFFDMVFKTLQEYLGDKFHLASAGITSAVVEELEGYNLDNQIIDKIKKCFDSCDLARYAPASIKQEDMEEIGHLIDEIIDQLQRVKI